MTATAITPAHCRRHISDRAWETIAPHLSGGPGKPRLRFVSLVIDGGHNRRVVHADGHANGHYGGHPHRGNGNFGGSESTLMFAW